MKNTFAVSVVVLAVVAGLVYMSMNRKTPVNTATGGVNQEANVKDDMMTTDTSIESGSMEEKVVVVEASNFKFNIDTIIVKKGEKTKIVFKNLEGMHDFRVDKLGIKTKILEDAGEETIEFTADEVGTFEFYCSVGEHRSMGMIGTLVVEE